MAAAASTHVEFDFFRMEKETTFPQPPTEKLFERKRSFRDIQGVISKINPEVVKAVIASGSANAVSLENCDVQSPTSGKKHQILPLYNPMYSFCTHQTTGVETAPMTIFYNGGVTVFDVPRQQAESILRVAGRAAHESNPDIRTDLFSDNGGLPLTRRKSLKRFLEKRKQRQTTNMGSPNDAFFSQNADDKEKELEDEAETVG